MQIYLVGGAIRNQLLGEPVTERDWVVIGATPNEMLELNYQAVGKDFPVFLHPLTKEEYALARTERKSNPGYYGFQCDFNPNVSLPDDLLRRDLTINAIAMDHNGNIIDPYNGLADLAKRQLRHVSPAFIEDPVRVLRVARFMARFGHLGFTVAPETMRFMQQMVANNELNYLVAERVWQEWQSSLTTNHPDLFIITLHDCGALKTIIPELEALLVSDSQILQTLKTAVKLSTDPVIRFAALVYHVDSNLKTLCERFRIPTKYSQLAIMVAKYHNCINKLTKLTPEEIVQTLEKTDAFRRPEIFDKMLVICDALMLNTNAPCNSTHWRHLLHVCKLIKPLTDNTDGQTIKNHLHAQRVIAVQNTVLA